MLITVSITLVKNVILDIELGDGYLACNRHHYVASIFLALLLYSGITFCDFTSLTKCIHVVHRYLGTHVHGILGERLHSWYRGRLGNRSLGEKHHPKWYREEVLPKLEEDLKNEAEGKK